MSAIDKYGPTIKEIDSFIRELDPSIRLETYTFLFKQEQKQLGHPAMTPLKPSADGERGISPQELIRRCKASSLMDKAVVLAYWIEEYQDKGHFTSAELKSAFASAREPAPANPSDVVAKLEAAGKLMRAEKTGKAQYYRLTQTGLDQIHGWLNPSTEEEET